MSFTLHLAQKLGKSKVDVENFLYDAPEKYKIYSIPKRKHGFRLIAQPSRELKLYQRKFISTVSLPIHDAAMAYRDGKSIKDNALLHSHNSYLLKLDLENFFNSITPQLFWNVWAQNGDVPHEKDCQWINRMLFWNKDGKLVLSVGAPSSPLISNFCMYYFDEALSNYCRNQGVVYTRYADDLTFSTNSKNKLFSFPTYVQELLIKHFSGSLIINQSKTTFSSKAHNRHVTGVTITNDAQLSLGRAKKRYIKHKVHQFKISNLDMYETQHLKGLLSFAKHIEPEFYTSLIKKYTRELLEKIFEVKYEQ